jgi:putative membrane protein
VRGLVLRFLVSALALGLTSWIVHGIHTDGFRWLLAAALILGILNAVIRPILILFTLPINFLTLGLFTFVINAIMLKVTAWMTGNHFRIDGFLPALLGAVVLAIVSGLLNWLVKDAREKRREAD